LKQVYTSYVSTLLKSKTEFYRGLDIWSVTPPNCVFLSDRFIHLLHTLLELF